MEQNRAIAETVRSAVTECGAWMLERDAGSTVWEKTSQRDVVTSLDIRIQEALVRALSAAFPNASFFSEEDAGRSRPDGELVFVIDPIDGTMNFVKGLHYSCISVACLRHGEPAVGVVYDPYHGELFSAIRGGGAFRNGVPIAVTDAPLDRSLVFFGTSPYNGETLDETLLRLRRLYLRSADLRRMGAAALDICHVAEGKAGLFFESSLALWDYAAAALILTEAGGRLCDFQGDPLPFHGEKSSVIAGSSAAIGDSGLLEPPEKDEQARGEIAAYLDYLRQRGFSYQSDGNLELIRDMETLLAYSRSHPGRLGIRYRSAFHTFVVDLVRTKDGSLLPYERLEKTAPGNSVVIIPVHDGRLVLLRQFRHALGEHQWCFPRGFGEPDITPEENARKEISEELNCAVTEAVHLGVTVADSGICGEKTHVFLCRVDSPGVRPFYEGIEACRELTPQEFEALIADGQINDGYTLAAAALLRYRADGAGLI